MSKFGRVSVSVIVFALAVFSQATWVSAQATPVDLELSLLIDVSGSVDGTEFALQRQGYESAFDNSQVHGAITGGANGAIAVQLVYWDTSSYIGVDWTLIDSAATSQAFADAVAAAARPSNGSTVPSQAINFAVPGFTTNAFDGQRLVIDVSGDGTGNDAATEAARDNAAANGISINGVAIGSESLRQWYEDHMITGEGSFANLAASFEDFEQAILEKLLAEIAGTTPVSGDVVRQVDLARNIANLQMVNIGFNTVGRRNDEREAVMFVDQDRWFMPGAGEQAPANALALGDTVGLDPVTGRAGSAILAAAMTAADDEAEPKTTGALAPWVFDERTRYGVWGAARYTWGTQDVTTTGVQEDYSVAAGTVGADYQIIDQLRVGAAVGYSGTEADLLGDGDMEIDGVTFALYATWTPSERLYVDTILGFTYLWYDMHRDTGGGAFADSDTDGYQIMWQGRAGYDFALTGAFENWVIGPYGQLNYLHSYIDDYTESGPGAVTVEDQDADSLVSRLGAQFSYVWTANEELIVVPQLRVAWAHEYLDDSRTVNVALAGSPGSTIGIATGDPDRNWFEVGVGASANFRHNWSLFANYDAVLGNEDYDAHTISAGLRYAF